MITDEQIKDRAKAIGDRPAFPVIPSGLQINSRYDGEGYFQDEIGGVTGYTGMTYRSWLIGNASAHIEINSPLGLLNWADSILYEMAKAELEAEEVGND